jgi:hypothetical protein
MKTLRHICLLSLFIASPLSAHAKTITVHSNADSGPGSLRQALGDAATGDTINLDVKGMVVLTSGELVVNKNLTIRGPGPHAIISGNNASRVFHLTPRVTVTLDSLTVTNGVASTDPNNFPANAGGGIYSDHAKLTVNNCRVTNNVANLGGGVFNNSKDGGSATLIVNNTTISGNIARSTIGYDGARGGGIFSGGGFFNTGPSGDATLTVNKSAISGNSAESYGGGIFNDGFNGSATLVITESVISGNKATDNLNGYAYGGGIYNNGETGRAPVTLTKCTLSDNSAFTFGGGIDNYAVFTGVGPLIFAIGGESTGGSAVDYHINFTAGQEYVIYEYAEPQVPGENFDAIIAVIDPTGSTILDQDTYVDEVVKFVAPVTGQYTIRLHPFFDNGIPTMGHFSVHVYSVASASPGTANVMFNNCTISGNSVSNGEGGGIFSVAYAGATTLVTLTQCVVIRNSAGNAEFGGSSGGIHFQGEIADGKSKLTLNSSVVKDNFAAGDAGGIEIKQTLAQLTDTEISGNSTGQYGDGGGIGIDDSLGSSGISEVNLTNCTVTANSAKYGGGIETKGLDLELFNSTISGNSADFGGGIFAENGQDGDSTVRLENSTLSGNLASDGGGGIFNAGFNIGVGGATATLEVINSTVSGNSAQFGGGILIETFGLGDFLGDTLIGHSIATLHNSTMSGNSANFGGGILTWGSNADFGISSVNIANSILNAGRSGENLVAFEDGTITSLGYNLSSDSAGGDSATAPGGLLNRPGDIRNTNPLLGLLKDNGGPTMTHALLDHSPAINAGNPNFNPYLFNPPLLYDQRGVNFPRTVSGRVDIGAFEAKHY